MYIYEEVILTARYYDFYFIKFWILIREIPTLIKHENVDFMYVCVCTIYYILIPYLIFLCVLIALT